MVTADIPKKVNRYSMKDALYRELRNRTAKREHRTS
jgi:hypothetical protein